MGHKIIPIIFGIMFFSTVFSAQNVYGPHFTSLDDLRYDFQGTSAFFDVFVNLSDGHANSKKKADFEICVHLETATDTTTVPIEIVQLELVSCEPITVVNSDQKNFELLHFRIPTEPIVTTNQVADISGFIELTNPGGKSVGGITEFTVSGVELGIPACIPPTCENNCNGHGVCVADDVCQCEKGWDSQADCSVPECTTNEQCSDNDQCTVDVCNENQCVSAPIPGCVPNDQCTSNDDCVGSDECTVGLCDSIGNCQFAQIPGCTVCEPTGAEVCDGLDNDCDGTVDEGNPEGGASCSTGLSGVCSAGTTSCEGGSLSCTSNVDPTTEVCDGSDNDCDGTVDEGNPGGGASCSTGLSGVCSAGTTSCEGGAISCIQTTTSSPEVCDGLDNDCDGVIDDGMHDHINTESSAQFLGAFCTDTKSGFLCPDNSFVLFSTQTGNTGKYFRVTAEECSDCSADLEMRFDLSVPPGIDYDLYVFDTSGELLGASRTVGDERVTVNIPEEIGLFDQSVDLIIEVRYITGVSCEDWTLQSFQMR